MNAGILKRFRRRASRIALALVLAFVLPILLQVLPGPALSAEDRLEQQLAQSRCSPGGEQSPAAQHSHEECCVLCVTGLPPVGEGKLLGGIAVPPPASNGAVVLEAAAAPVDRKPPFLTAISLRGPPRLA